MSPAINIAERCPYCQRFRWPEEITEHAGGVRMCVDCWHKHEAAVLALSGLRANSDGTLSVTIPPKLECSECAGPLKGKGSIVYEGGVYRMFCGPCAASYIPKRREFFAGTQYARMKGLE